MCEERRRAAPSRPAGKHYDARLDAQQRKLQDMAAEQEEWEQPASKQ